jgi:small-conductance mechanosensitive channel/CRP-like cAMP-binding protein
MIAVTWPWHDQSPSLQATMVAGSILLPVLIVLQGLLLPPPKRHWLVGPLVLLTLYLLVSGAALVFDDPPELRNALVLTAYFFLLIALGRCLFALMFFGVLHWLHQHVPKIFVDLIQAFVYLLALLLTLIAAGVDPLSLLTGSAVLTVVLGLSLKDTLGNLFAGIAIQAQQPFEIGDWIQFDPNPLHIGRVVETNWRAITVITLDEVEVTVPNGTLGIGSVVNFTKPQVYSRRSLYVHAPYGVPPRQVQALIVRAISESFGVLREPPPSVVTNAFDERGVQYWVRFFTDRFDVRDGVDGAARDCIWYALHRAGIAIPGLQQMVSMQSAPVPPTPEDPATRREHALRAAPLFAELNDTERRRLAEMSQTRLFAPHEVILREGDAGEEMFLILRGQVGVSMHPVDAERVPLNKLGPGEFFGEMSLIQGARRSASVQALDECELIVIDGATLRQLLDSSPGLAERIHAVVRERLSRLEDAVETFTHAALEQPEQHFLLRLLAQFLPNK